MPDAPAVALPDPRTSVAAGSVIPPAPLTRLDVTLTPTGSPESGGMPDRLASAVAEAERLGLRVSGLTLALDCSAGRPDPVAAARTFLKRAGRRCGLRASWPVSEGD